MLRQLALKLDRPGGRWLLSSMLPLLGRLAPNGVRSLSYSDGWTHRFDRLYSVEPTPRLRGHHLDGRETALYWGLLYKPKPNDTIVDIGAGLGTESVYWAGQVGPEGRVISIEAQPRICAYLKRTMELNGLKQARVLNLAVADKAGVVRIEDDLDNHLGNSLNAKGKGVPVPALSLDEIARNEGLGRVDFLKMNIEGAERLAVLGAKDLFARTAILSISCHDFKYTRTGDEFFKTKALVSRALHEAGFVCVPRMDERPEIADQVNAFNPRIVPEHEILPQSR